MAEDVCLVLGPSPPPPPFPPGNDSVPLRADQQRGRKASGRCWERASSRLHCGKRVVGQQSLSMTECGGCGILFFVYGVQVCSVDQTPRPLFPFLPSLLSSCPAYCRPAQLYCRPIVLLSRTVVLSSCSAVLSSCPTMLSSCPAVLSSCPTVLLYWLKFCLAVLITVVLAEPKCVVFVPFTVPAVITIQ